MRVLSDQDRAADEARFLRKSLAGLQRRLRSERSDTGVGLSRYSALGCLIRNGPMSAGQLASHERLQPQSLTRILAALEGEKLIVRSPDREDHRRARIQITQRGIAVLRENVLSEEAWLARAISQALTSTERELLLLAAQLIDRLSAAPIETSARAVGFGSTPTRP
jgi:DNA-binding MarR family transcriptional regulator